LLSYEIYYSEDVAGPYLHTASVSVAAPWYLDFPVPDASAKPGNCYRVSAVNTGGEGTHSVESCFQPSYFPTESEGTHGGTAWGVYVVANDVADYSSKSSVATGRLEALGYQWFAYGVELACDQGSAAALGKPSDTIAVAIYFASESDAEAFATAYFYEFGDSVVGTGQVETYCLD